jgi:hypothetical protein
MDPLIAAGLIIMVFLISGIMIFSLVRAFASLAPWVPSNLKMVGHALKYIAPSKGQTFADLGCGDGRIVFYANNKYQLQADGFERAFVPFILAKLRQLKYRHRPVSIKLQNLYKANLTGYDIVFVYGLPQTINERLAPKLASELKSGAYLISYNFRLRNKAPVKKFHNSWRNIYIYQF